MAHLGAAHLLKVDLAHIHQCVQVQRDGLDKTAGQYGNTYKGNLHVLAGRARSFSSFSKSQS